MKSILEQFYYEDMRLEEGPRRTAEQEKRAAAFLAKYEAFRDSLGPSQRVVYDEVTEAELRMLSEDGKKDFINAFRLGARIMLEVLVE